MTWWHLGGSFFFFFSKKVGCKGANQPKFIQEENRRNKREGTRPKLPNLKGKSKNRQAISISKVASLGEVWYIIPKVN
jgi:hypothetical protein